jgi:hypothetical protein
MYSSNKFEKRNGAISVCQLAPWGHGAKKKNFSFKALTLSTWFTSLFLGNEKNSGAIKNGNSTRLAAAWTNIYVRRNINKITSFS